MWTDSKRSRNICGVIGFWVVLLAANAAILSMLGCASGSTAAAPSQTPSITSSSSAVRIGESVSFSVTGSSSKGTWQVVGGTDNGQIDQNGVYTPPASLPQPNTVTVEYVQTQNALKAVLSVLNPKPTLTGVTPQQITASVTNLVIKGTGFVRSSQIVIGGTSMPTTMVDQSTLTTTVSFAPGTNTSVSVLVANPDPGVASSSSITVPVAIPNISVSPTSIAGGNVQLSLSGITSNPSDLLVKLDDRLFTVAPGTNASVSANGYLPPWHTGQAYLTVSSISTGKELAHFSLGIQPTAVSFDTAAHFLMQAGFGPRPDLVQHVQQIGLEAFIAEQQALPTEPYQNSMTLADIMKRAAFGNAPLRIKVALALQSYIPRPGLSGQSSNAPFEVLMEKDSTGNYRDLMTDICSDPSLTMFLNLPGNAASTDPSNPPNQNFARELLQLFTLGTIALNDDGTTQLNADGSAVQVYDQDTIMNLSRVLTGWNNAPPQNPTFTFYGVDWSAPLVATPSQHDYGAKRVLGTNIPAGLTPEQDRKMALDIIFAHPNMPPFVSRILIQRLVKSNPSKDFVRRISNVFKDDGKGVRGNLASVVRAILLDPEARAGDTTTGEMYGFLQSPYLFLTSVMGMTGLSMTDLQPSYIPCALKECVFYPSTVFGSFSPSYRIPGTNINAPEFQIFDNLTLVNRSQILWAMLTNNQPGMTRGSNTWLYTNFQTVPQLVDAINHLAYHGQMTQERQTAIVNAATQLGTDSVSAQNVALFLALNADTYSVVQ